MNQKDYKLLHYVLIILLMFAPMRSVFAMESSHCDMDGEMEMSVQPLTVADQSSDYLDSTLLNDSQSKQMNPSCCDDNGCSSGSCDMSMGASLLIQIASYSPVFLTAESILAFSSELQLRALTPPSRPPLATS